MPTDPQSLPSRGGVSPIPSNGTIRAAKNGPPSAYPLPRGHHGIPPELVAQNQRQRLIAGLAQALGEHGYASLTVARVISAFGISRKTFYENFKNGPQTTA